MTDNQLQIILVLAIGAFTGVATYLLIHLLAGKNPYNTQENMTYDEQMRYTRHGVRQKESDPSYIEYFKLKKASNGIKTLCIEHFGVKSTKEKLVRLNDKYCDECLKHKLLK